MSKLSEALQRKRRGESARVMGFGARAAAKDRALLLGVTGVSAKEAGAALKAGADFVAVNARNAAAGVKALGALDGGGLAGAQIAALDADVISMEAARSSMELLGAFKESPYPNHIGPGVYDIHSPRVPHTDEMDGLLSRAAEVLSPEQLWVNPDCGLKTRGWAEVEPSLKHMIAAAKRARRAAKPRSRKSAAKAAPRRRSAKS